MLNFVGAPHSGTQNSALWDSEFRFDPCMCTFEQAVPGIDGTPPKQVVSFEVGAGVKATANAAFSLAARTSASEDGNVSHFPIATRFKLLAEEPGPGSTAETSSGSWMSLLPGGTNQVHPEGDQKLS